MSTPTNPQDILQKAAADVAKRQRIQTPVTTITPVHNDPNERVDLSAVNAPERVQTPLEVNKPRPGAIRGLAESDAAIAAITPQLGDSVQVDVDLVPYDLQKEHHHRLRMHSVNGRYGTVIGTEIVGGTLFLRIETSTANVLVPADAIRLANPPEQQNVQHEPRVSPEKMRKPSTGAWKMT